MDRQTINHKILLKSLKESINDACILDRGNHNELTGTLQREALTLFLIAETMKYLYRHDSSKTFQVLKSLDTDRLDGFIRLKDSNEEIFYDYEFEQVSQTQFEPNDANINQKIIAKITQKHEHGYTEPEKIILTVFIDEVGEIQIDTIKESLRIRHDFAFYFLITLDREQTNEHYFVYVIVNLQPELDGHSRIFIKVPKDCSTWEVFELEEE